MIKKLPNILSILRGLLAIPLAYSILYSNQNLILILIVLIVLSDYYDGYFARKYKNISEIGKILDPIADKICGALIVITLYHLNKLPLYFLILTILRDVLIVLGGLYAKKKLNFVIPSNNIGKFTANILALYFIGLIFNFPMFENYGHIFTSAFLVFSFSVYFFRFYKVLNNGIYNE